MKTYKAENIFEYNIHAFFHKNNSLRTRGSDFGLENIVLNTRKLRTIPA